MTYEEAKKRVDYHFSINELEGIIEDIQKGWLDDFEENGDPMRGAAVLEIGYVDIEVNIFSEEQICREGVKLSDEKRKAPVIDYFYCVKIPPDQTFQANAELFIQKQKSKFRFNSIPGFIYCYWWPCRNR